VLWHDDEVDMFAGSSGKNRRRLDAERSSGSGTRLVLGSEAQTVELGAGQKTSKKKRGFGSYRRVASWRGSRHWRQRRRVVLAGGGSSDVARGDRMRRGAEQGRERLTGGPD
jgi:hypothetical protein